MAPLSSFTAAERLESLKAAVIGSICAGSISLGGLIGNRFLSQGVSALRLWSPFGLATLTLLVTVAIASLSGALFALTYRYAVRQDQNPQLNVGVVLAFTLIRGLAQVDAGSAIAQKCWPFLAACSESFLIFASTALALTWATQNYWIATFGDDASVKTNPHHLQHPSQLTSQGKPSEW